MSRFKSQVAKLKRVSADFGSPAGLLIRMVAARLIRFIDRVHDFAEANRPAGQRAVRAFLDYEFEQ